jgi:hypothetical protein
LEVFLSRDEWAQFVEAHPDVAANVVESSGMAWNHGDQRPVVHRWACGSNSPVPIAKATSEATGLMADDLDSTRVVRSKDDHDQRGS